MDNKANSLAHTKWMCKYHIVFTPNTSMKISKKQFEKIKKFMPIERKPEKIPNQQFLNALLYIIENSCKLMGITKKYSN